MEGRMKKYKQQVSPERAKVWREKSPKYQQKIKKVAVVYYLSRNRQLEHPHFMEVPLSSPDGLYLRDVIERLNVLRGRGMASVYSWSSKRNYRNGFVWHDLSEDDLILPAHGNEYVLKGSELLDDSDRFGHIVSSRTQNLKQLPEPPSSRSLDDSSSASSMNGKGTKHSQEDDLSPTALPSCYSAVSPDSRNEKNSFWGGTLCLTEYKVYKSEGLADASTQTDENVSRSKSTETCSRGVSTDDGSLGHESSDELHDENPCPSDTPCPDDCPDICRNSVSPPSSNSASSLGGNTETLESLIRADASKMNSFRILEQEDVRMPANARLKATTMLMQLISCGSIAVKDNSFGIVPTYKPKFGRSKFPSPFFSTSFMLGELDCLSENPRIMGLRSEDREYFSGGLVETKLLKDAAEGKPSLKRSSSCNADRTCTQPDSAENKDNNSNHGGGKCVPRSAQASIIKHPRSGSMRSPDGYSIQMTEPTRRSEEGLTKIEERLASGARVVIQSKTHSDSAVVSCSS